MKKLCFGLALFGGICILIEANSSQANCFTAISGAFEFERLAFVAEDVSIIQFDIQEPKGPIRHDICPQVGGNLFVATQIDDGLPLPSNGFHSFQLGVPVHLVKDHFFVFVADNAPARHRENIIGRGLASIIYSLTNSRMEWWLGRLVHAQSLHFDPQIGLRLDLTDTFLAGDRPFSGGGRSAGGNSGPPSKKQRDEDGEKTAYSEVSLETCPPDGIFGCLSHPYLLAQIGILALLGFVATWLVILDIGYTLGLLGNWRRRRFGYGLLLLGLLGWGWEIGLCFVLA